MRTAIVVPAFNVEPWLPDCLASLQAQTHHDWFAVVVDDGSIDGTANIVARRADPRIRLVRQANAGVSAARNRGLDVALNAKLGDGPDAVLFLDADDWLAPDALARLAATLEASPWAVAAVGAYARVRTSGACNWVNPPGRGDLLPALLTRNLFVNGGHVLMTRDGAETAGYFRTDLCYGEDWEFWTRLALAGEFVSLSPGQPVLFHRERPGSAYRGMATNPALARKVLDTIYANSKIASRLDGNRLARLRAKAEAELGWSIGREMIRHGHAQAGRAYLIQSIRESPTARRLALFALSLLRTGPFRPYGMAI